MDKKVKIITDSEGNKIDGTISMIEDGTYIIDYNDNNGSWHTLDLTQQELDNMTVEDMKKAVDLCRGKAETECSGNVTRENVARLVDIGVDYISSGALTHSSPILDLSLKNLHAI